MNSDTIRRFLLRTCLALSCLAIPVAGARAAVGEWVDGNQARIRLVAAAPSAKGEVDAAIEIELDPEWKTYWRSPGDAGIPPVIDFSGSANLKPVSVAYPVPERFDEGGSISNVYRDEAVLVATSTLADPGKPARLTLKLDIGVCQEICVPEHFETTLAIDGADDPEATRILADARRDLPSAPEPGVFAVKEVRRAGGDDKRPVFEVDATVPEAASAEVFVEGPADWYPDTPALVTADGPQATYKVTFDRLTAKTPIAGSSLRVTIKSSGRAIEQSVKLD